MIHDELGVFLDVDVLALFRRKLPVMLQDTITMPVLDWILDWLTWLRPIPSIPLPLLSSWPTLHKLPAASSLSQKGCVGTETMFRITRTFALFLSRSESPVVYFIASAYKHTFDLTVTMLVSPMDLPFEVSG